MDSLLERSKGLKEEKHLESDEYIKDLEEWMEHQYNPGYWTGGKIPPHIKYMRKPSHLILILLGTVIFAFSVIYICINYNSDLSNCLMALVWLLIGGIIAISNFKELWSKREK